MKKFNFNEVFSTYIPYLSEITGLDLNFYHAFQVDPEISPNFGVKDLYAIGNSGHKYIVYCIIPGLSPEQYPIAVYDEEGEARMISNSIKNWFPYYFVERINYLLIWYTKELSKPAEEAYDWYEKDLGSIEAHKEELIEICKVFDNAAFMEILPKVFEAIESRDITKWEYERFLKIAASNSPIAQYMECKEKNLPNETFAALIKENPHYNAPLLNQLGRLSSKTNDIPLEVALEAFKRRVTFDFGDSIQDVLFLAAAKCYEEMDKDSVYYPFIEEIVEFDDEPYNFAFGGWYYGLGNALEEAGRIDEAVIAYENAIMRNSAETEEFHEEAFEALKGLASKLDDENYSAYLNSYLEEDEYEENEDEE